MSNNLQIFDFKALPFRTTVDENGNPWFCGKDVCDILGYANHNDAIKKTCKPKGVANSYPLETAGGIQYPVFIDEGNLYRLIIKSNKPEAEPFEAWVCDEVLPSIRKTGGYVQSDSHLAGYVAEIKSHLETQKQLTSAQQLGFQAYKDKAEAYIAHLTQQNQQLNRWLAEKQAFRQQDNERLNRAIRAQSPIKAAEALEIAELFEQGWDVKRLSIWFYRSPAIVRRAIRDAGGAV